MQPKSLTPKTHGFSNGLNFQQIFSYFLILFKLILFQFFIICNFSTTLQILLSILYYPATLVVIIYGYITTAIDPTDEVVYLERQARQNGDPFDSERFELHCEICETSVSNNTKHCRTCNRCVANFDHHCEWVNNCINEKNYRPFVMLISSLAVSLFIFNTVGILFLVDYFSQKIGIIQDLDLLKRDPNGEWKTILIMFFTILNTGLFLLDMRLIVFHIYISRHNMTTYDYIIKGREAAREKKSKRRSSLMIRRGQIQSDETTSKGLGTKDESPVEIEDKKENRNSNKRNKQTSKGSFSKLFNEKSTLHHQDAEHSPNDKMIEMPPYLNSQKNQRKGNEKTLASLSQEQLSNLANLAAHYEDQNNGNKHSFNFDIESQLKSSSSRGGHKFEHDVLISPKTPGGSGRYLMPSSGGVSSHRSSMQDLVVDDRKDEFDPAPESRNGDGLDGAFDNRFVAFSLAKIASNYEPKYGQIMEEENESERPTVSEYSQRMASRPY